MERRENVVALAEAVPTIGLTDHIQRQKTALDAEIALIKKQAGEQQLERLAQ